MSRSPWKSMTTRAQRVIDDALAEMPADLRTKAKEVPVLFHEWCADDPDLLGTYAGFSLNEVSEANGPIVLYLRAIEAYAAEEGDDFSMEVRRTYLHELGHHFGWDEVDLEERGLE